MKKFGRVLLFVLIGSACGAILFLLLVATPLGSWLGNAMEIFVEKVEKHNERLVFKRSETSAPIIPGYVAKVRVQQKDFNGVVVANAILINREHNLLLTNAHVVENASSFEVEIGDNVFSAHTNREWVDLEADLALLRLSDNFGFTLPRTAILHKQESLLGKEVMLGGYFYPTETSYLHASYTIHGVVVEENAAWGRGHLQWVKRHFWRLAHKWNLWVPDSKKKFLRNEFAIMNTECTSVTFRLQEGMSGSPVISESMVAGIISGGKRCVGGFTPAGVIERFIDVALKKKAP